MKPAGFSIVELVVVISILAILGTISFMSFSQYLVDARNSDRATDMGQLKISLRTSKQRTGNYPLPGNRSPLKYDGLDVAFQWFFDQSLAINTISKIPTDPRVADKYYSYSVTKNRQAFQVCMTIEGDESTLNAFVDGDYKTVAKTALPSIMTSLSGATIELKDTVWLGTTNRKAFVFDGSKANLCYDMTGNPKTNTTLDFSAITSERWVNILSSSEYSTCLDIYEAGKSIGNTTYQVIDENGTLTDTGCTMTF